jgi:PBSX family phage portal protein
MADGGKSGPGIGERVEALKAFVIGDETARETSRAVDEVTKSFEQAGAIVPPYDPRVLNDLFENSSALRPNVDAYATNIDANGFHLEPSVSLSGDDARKIVRDAIYLERLEARDKGSAVDPIPSEDEVAERIKLVDQAMALEQMRVLSFFDACTVEESFTSLRRRTRQDLEVTGNAYWEILRDDRGRVTQFVYLPVSTMRLTTQGREFVPVIVPRRLTPITVIREKRSRRFRRFVQIVEGSPRSTVFFKELGDPRVMSSKTGTYYTNDLAMKAKEGADATTATEVFHFRIPSSGTPYGVPRWVGALLSVFGTRHAEEVNYLYFENKSVPPLAMLVSGGRVSADSVKRIESYVENQIKGKKNFHKILIIEAEPTGGDIENNGRMKIELRPLTQAQQSDALFQKYDERNADKVGIMFRLPRMLRGDVRDFNRSTAEAALEFAERQVFGPERVEFDFTINRFVLADLDVRYWKFVSNSVQVRDPQVMANIIAKLKSANVLVAADARELVGELVFDRKLPEIDADWIYQPEMLTQVGIPFDTEGEDRFIPTRDDAIPPNGIDPTADGVISQALKGGRTEARTVNLTRRFGAKHVSAPDLAAMASEIIALRDALVEAEKVGARKRFADAAAAESASANPRESVSKSDDDDGAVVLRVPLSVLVDELGIEPT